MRPAASPHAQRPPRGPTLHARSQPVAQEPAAPARQPVDAAQPVAHVAHTDGQAGFHAAVLASGQRRPHASLASRRPSGGAAHAAERARAPRGPGERLTRRRGRCGGAARVRVHPGPRRHRHRCARRRLAGQNPVLRDGASPSCATGHALLFVAPGLLCPRQAWATCAARRACAARLRGTPAPQRRAGAVRGRAPRSPWGSLGSTCACMALLSCGPHRWRNQCRLKLP